MTSFCHGSKSQADRWVQDSVTNEKNTLELEGTLKFTWKLMKRKIDWARLPLSDTAFIIQLNHIFRTTLVWISTEESDVFVLISFQRLWELPMIMWVNALFEGKNITEVFVPVL